MKPKNKTARIVGWSAALIILGIAAYFLFFDNGGKEIVANADKVVRETLVRKVSATGTINPVQTVEVGTQVSGIISKLYVDFNDKVKAHQIIARMDTRNLLAFVKESQAALAKTEVQFNQAKRALERTTELFNNGVVAKIDIEAAEDDYQLALASNNSAKLQLERNQVNLDYATIRSPIDGIVISRKVDEGQTVAASFATPAFYVIANDLKKMLIEASVDEADIGLVKLEQPVEFRVDAFPDELFSGKVSQIQLQPVTLQNVVTYTVEIDIENKELRLMPGMTANLDILVTRRENVLTVPNGVFAFEMNDELARQIKNEGGVVKYAESKSEETIWKKQDNTFIEIPVEPGYSNGVKTEISGNINEGDEIVSSVEIVNKKKQPSGSFLMPQTQKDNEKKE